jgi:ABC-type multidrug transport system ATPase subunit
MPSPSSHEEPQQAVHAIGLHKHYGRRPAVTNVGFTVSRGEVCALLGPNGAGKTSTIRMLVGLSRPDQGTIRILDKPVNLGAAVLGNIGVLIDGPAFVPHLTGMKNLRLLWSATRQPWPPPALDDALDLAGLGHGIDRKVKSYSMGMKQRLMLAQALMRAPSVLILDEPANGLDPAEVRALRERLSDLARNGAAVLVSSHQLAEVQQLATHAVVLNQGRLIASGALTDLLGDTDAYQLEVDDPLRAANLLERYAGVSSVTVHDGVVTVTGSGITARELITALVGIGVGVGAARQPRHTLEDVFLKLTERGDDATG